MPPESPAPRASVKVVVFKVEILPGIVAELSVSVQYGEFLQALEKVRVQVVAAVPVVMVPPLSSPTTEGEPVPQDEMAGVGPEVKLCPSLSHPPIWPPEVVEVATTNALPVEAPD